MAVAVHPARRDQFSAVRDAFAFLRGDSPSVCETRGDDGDAGRLRDMIVSSNAHVVVAAGGDGTVASTVQALLALPAEQRPELAILPLGTANNVARSHGLASVRTHGRDAIERTIASLHSGLVAELDVGRANGQPFVGSFALGMDGAILRRRNQLRSSLQLGKTLGGYPLYLASCAIEALAHRAQKATITFDEERQQGAVYNLLATCCPIYAGEFRFAGSASSPGRLRVYDFPSRSEFLEGYTAAWRRHVRHQRGENTQEAPNARGCLRVRVELPEPMPAQLDGEEAPASRDWELETSPAAIRLRVPAVAG